MYSQLINENFLAYKFKLTDFLKQLYEFTIDVDDKEFQKIISDLRANINETFLLSDWILVNLNLKKSFLIN